VKDVQAIDQSLGTLKEKEAGNKINYLSKSLILIITKAILIKFKLLAHKILKKTLEKSTKSPLKNVN
jgi:hypothetical protein